MKKTSPFALVLVIALTLLVVGGARLSSFGTAGKLTALDQSNFDDIDVSFTAIAGQGAAHLQLRQAPDDVDPGTRTFRVEGTIDIHGALPDTSYRVARAVDRNDIGTPNGLCPALGASSSSWRPVSGMLSTSADGSGTLHFVIAPMQPTPFVSGVGFDVQWQIIKVNADGSLDPSQELRSDCFTVTVK